MSLARWPLLVSIIGFIYIFIIPETFIYSTLFFKLLPMAIILYYAYLRHTHASKLIIHSLIVVGIIVVCAPGTRSFEYTAASQTLPAPDNLSPAPIFSCISVLPVPGTDTKEIPE